MIILLTSTYLLTTQIICLSTLIPICLSKYHIYISASFCL